jgi:Protein of unknown function (DUF3224)
MNIAPHSTRASASLRSRLVTACLTPLLLATLSTQAQTTSPTESQTNPNSSAPTKKAIPSLHATGTFEVKIDPQPSDEKGGGTAIGRMLLDKQYHGDLEATSKGTMLAAGTGEKNSSGGYVALEIVTGSLKGRTGTFVLQHSATMNRGVPQLSITVVPDSGTAKLSGLAGKMNITIVDGKHSYDLEYTLSETP